jgi:acetolactate synthase small subunit
VSGILAGRGFNIDSLVVCRTEIRDLSRMCIVVNGQDGVVEQARRQLEDMVGFQPFFLHNLSDIYLIFLGSCLGSSRLHGN